MKMNKLSRKLIKPHTPTPQTLKNFKLSYPDELSPPVYFAVVLFYESKPEDGSLRLEESLARILVEFYPLAGRFIKNDSLIDCSDEGAELVEAEAPDVELIDLITKIENDQLDYLLPEQHFRPSEAPQNPLLSIQITRFSCGGAAIAISVYHRVFDASSLGTLVAAWSDAANPDHAKRVIKPSFPLPSLLPSVTGVDNLAIDVGPTPDSREQSVGADHKVVLKRVLFNEEAITRLKSRISQTNGKPLSGVRVVCAVIAKALIRLDGAIHGRSRSFAVVQAVNMRERTIPPQPRHACGNFAVPAFTPRVEAGDDVGVDELVRLLGDSVRHAISEHAEILSPDRDGRNIITNTTKSFQKLFCEPETNGIIISDWSRFGFHEADFGWGKPVLTSIRFGPPVSNNFVVLMSDKEGDGIEAWFHLYQHAVPYFEQDEEIKVYFTNN
ncbi:pelargonidin 3-O-(6-caffeoylglucoside) 5-O-(6-O-malonylglucoside) 4'''-malonyltransferase-like [Salvia miltiorrhiza]|uniref:pelargonidin 3-O-(6-caffeoylglucoside) 5-O-(6-O-malonylglucoside) 4'''-malonyltransferase-like n=1 Tax=Salvia miltiorrhiza TaxID=226208 RepID=UPI0025ABAC52|nr:pelargonidin 3-O-(6-caffeoylglucoside) 5-O-(6-O-malonylglucoside) 4'''-malonyltransferase-like [Salvia miltiorrhiza]